ncbi:LmeA family phospholipid-binding protein [Streptomyces sp. L500]|uniref:LmeA family phospholipid-binding protein n=1 Tax=Streptomyces abikoensis TaxID=97398 RepID=UPI0036940929
MRAIRRLLIVAIILAALFVGADRAAVYFAENQVADKIRSSQNLSGTPDVSIKGFPFLTQVASSRLDEVEIKLDGGVTAGAGDRSIKVSGFDATLHDVRVDSSYTSATAGRASGTAHLTYEELTKATGDPDVGVGYGGKDATGGNQVKVSGKVTVMGQTSQQSVISTVTVVNGDTVRVRANEVPSQGIPGLERKIREKTDFDRKITGLPRGIKLDTVVATPNGVDITLTGTDVNLAG